MFVQFVCSHIFLLSIFYFLFSASPAQALDCCLSASDPTDCRVQTQEKPCKISPTVEQVCKYERGDFGVSIKECHEEVRKAPEEFVSGCSRPQSCILAATLETDCTKLSSSKLQCQTSVADCFWFGQCYNRNDSQICYRINSQAYCEGTQGSLVCRWSAGPPGRCITRVEQELGAQYRRTGGVLPPCAYEGNCRSVSDFLAVMIALAREAFKYIGSFAFLMFVYGGVTMILSFGNAERFQKGRQILIAAVVGLTISFGAFILVDFILKTLFVTQFRAL